MQEQTDIIVVGAGPAGLAFCRALAGSSLNISIVEAHQPDVLADPPFDGREIALTHPSKAILENLGIWQRFPESEIHYLRAASVLNGDSAFRLHFPVPTQNSHRQAIDTLGYLVPNHIIRRAARARLQMRPDDAPAADALVLSSRASPAARRPAGAAVMVADCVPLLLAADDGTIVAAVHAGRRGMLDGVVTAAVEAMAGLGADPAGLWAAIGPAICGSCYEVPERMLQEAAAREPACAALTRWGTPGLDIAAGVVAQLRRAGVRRIDRPGWCTYEDRRFYSHRRDGTTGRIVGAALAAPTDGVGQ